jgi:HSP90 family molecular chaperone
VGELGAWLVAALPARVSRIRPTNRLRSSPCVVTDHESASLRRMMRMVESTSGKDGAGTRLENHILPKQALEVNPAHPVVRRLFYLKNADAPLALVVAEQMVDNALVAAGLIDDPRAMLPRLNALLERVVGLEAAERAPYEGAEALEKKRWTSPAEAEEKATLAAGEALAEAFRKEKEGKSA